MAHDHDHGHGQDHGDHLHPPASDDPPPPPEDGALETAIRELLIEKGVITAEDLHRQIDLMDSRNPALGARVVARAWTDPAFREALMAEPLSAIEATFDVAMTGGAFPALRVVADAPGLHNVVVCTLCSCYPRMLLGPPPAWYKAAAYRSRVVRDPRGVLAEFGTVLPSDTEVRVHDSTADLRYLVLPSQPQGTDDWDEAALAAIVTRDCMIGTALPRP